MGQKTFNLLVGIVFLAIAILHLLRAIYGWEAMIASQEIPLWLSWLAVLVSGLLAWASFSKKR